MWRSTTGAQTASVRLAKRKIIADFNRGGSTISVKSNLENQLISNIYTMNI
ncbi:hypothetical protein UYSO10_4258 [Kosakonia radicincitans]|nr:hypothetical protein UYSO10_4258 [Kosakonia radicincitans]